MISRRALVIAAVAAIAPVGSLNAQRLIDFHAGRWVDSEDAWVFQFRSGGRLFGPVSHGVTLLATINDSLGRRRAFYGVGWELILFRPARFGPYAVAGVAAGLSTDSGPHQLAAQWTAGAGLEWKPFPFVGAGVEARYRLEDRGPEGFWNATDARKGVSVTAGVVMRWPSRSSRTRSAAAAPAAPAVAAAPTPVAPPPPAGTYVPLSAPRLVAAPTRFSGPAGNVASTAVGALGTPYRWGGTAENGFDCSGLVQWAYSQHGVQVPRMSAAQASAGVAVTPSVEALTPGDILLFAAEPGGGVTHVGMYVGERKFIHSSSAGVRISLLDYSDANGSYWMRRWVGARRVLP